MYHEGAPEFVDHQGLYYPPASNCGYYCTGFELPVEWEDHQNIFSVDGPEIQHAGAHTESLPYVYYTPSYGYTQPTYNPYNPYIPGAMMGDGTLVGAQQYYSITPYQNLASSPAIVPIVVQPDIIANSSPDPLLDPNSPITNRSDGRGLRQNLNHASIAYSRKPQKSALDQASSLTRVSDRPSKQTLTHGSVSSASYPSPAAMRIYQDRSASDSVQPKLFSRHNQLRVGLSTGNGLADLESSVPEAVAQSKLRPEMNVVRDMSEAGRTPDMMGDQNRGPRTNRLKTQFSVKAYTIKVGDSDSEGNITIHADQYNRDDFSLDYADAKFFVIKSYSEDDVHKSIKYNVWSSTPHGNKKLEIAYEDAQKIATELSSDCPIFLFYSVNASGQFCGVAEMVGSVNFQKDMDFWQQDKWSGSFPVKWHIIKDVPNSHLRHIILENNENKPVTNSRDTQEIMYKQGMEMLKIFKNHTMKTSLLDDFMYYENRQKIMHEEKASLLYKTLGDSLLGPLLDPGKKLQYIQRALEHEKITKESEHGSLEKTASTSSEQVSIDSDVNKVTEMSEKAGEIAAELRDVTVSTINIGSLTINPKQAGSKPSIDSAVAAGNSSSVQIVTVGSMPVKVNGTAESSGYLTVGTIQLKSRSLQPDGGASAKGGSPS